MKAFLIGLFGAASVLAADPLPYDLASAQHLSCLGGTEFEFKLPAADRAICRSSVEGILSSLRYDYGVGERPEEDGCVLGALQMPFETTPAVKLRRNARGELRASLACFPDFKPGYLIYINYDPAADRIFGVEYTDL